jgi:hypothetical protein
MIIKGVHSCGLIKKAVKKRQPITCSFPSLIGRAFDLFPQQFNVF